MHDIRQKVTEHQPVYCDWCGKKFKTTRKISAYDTTTGKPVFYILKDHGLSGSVFFGCGRLFKSHDDGKTWISNYYGEY